MRFREIFANGELGNQETVLAEKAKGLCKEAIDVTKELGGDQITIWLGYDGFDYSFQLNYIAAWNQIVEAFRQIADYDNSIMGY